MAMSEVLPVWFLPRHKPLPGDSRRRPGTVCKGACFNFPKHHGQRLGGSLKYCSKCEVKILSATEDRCPCCRSKLRFRSRKDKTRVKVYI